MQPSSREFRDYLTLLDASKLPQCNVKASSLRLAVNRGKLKAVKVGNVWMVHIDDLDSYLKNRKVGRPLKIRYRS
jgi:hypothetical protein